MKRKRTHSPIDRIPNEILCLTFSFLLDENPNYNKILRYICRRWKSLIPSGQFNPNKFLEYSASNGYENLCRLAKDWGEGIGTPADASLAPLNFDRMFKNGARNGHKNICELAKEWGVTDFNYMLYWATESGHEDLCRLAESWGAGNFDDMWQCAAFNGYENLCILAESWGAENYYTEMVKACKKCGERLDWMF